MMDWSHWSWNGWMGAMGMGIGGVFMLLFWALVMLVVVLLIRWQLSSTGDADRARRSPRDILDERYASGEIGREEYEQKRRDLGD
jgi:putative membrane protein